jgi:3-dehydroquinate synthase
LITEKLSIEEIKELVPVAMKFKIKVVEEDAFEKGLRLSLNFGHSIGHALESVFLDVKKSTLLHGEAVVAGMIMETYIAAMKGILDQKVSNDIVFQLVNYFGTHRFDASLKDEMISFIRHDKKNRNGKFYFSLIKEIGVPEWNIEVEEKLVADAYDFYLRLQ